MERLNISSSFKSLRPRERGPLLAATEALARRCRGARKTRRLQTFTGAHHPRVSDQRRLQGLSESPGLGHSLRLKSSSRLQQLGGVELRNLVRSVVKAPG